MIIIESKRKKAAIEREQNQACLSYAKREQARLHVKAATILKMYPDAILASSFLHALLSNRKIDWNKSDTIGLF